MARVEVAHVVWDAVSDEGKGGQCSGGENEGLGEGI